MSIPEEFFDNLDAGFNKQAEEEKTKQEQDENTETWEPEAGDKLSGTFNEVKFLPTRYGVRPMAVITDRKDGVWEVWCSGTVLRKAMEEAQPEPGSLIGIMYEGFVETPDKEYDGYHMHRVMTPDRSPEMAAAGAAHWREAEQLGDIRAAKKAKADAEKKEVTTDFGPDEAPF